MARTSKANVAANEATIVADGVVNENVDDVQEEASVSNNAVEKKQLTNKKQTAAKADEPVVKQIELKKDDEIDVISLIPNVSYKEKATGDIYNWYDAGQVEVMTFGSLQNMWREYKGYFKNMWLKPMDERVIKKFGLKDTYEKYDFLMDGKNYTKENIDKICHGIKDTPSALKLSLCNKVKNLVTNGEVTNISVIREIEKALNIDLISLID